MASDVLCRDGGLVRLRTLTIDNADSVIQFYRQLDPLSLYRRFMTHTLPHDEILLAPITSVDPRDQVIGAEVAGELIAIGLAVHVAEYDAAEVAFAVLEPHQGRGIGTILLEHLAATARDRGRTHFFANTMSNNLAMLDMFEQAGFSVTEQERQGDVTVRLTLDQQADDEVARRDLRSHAASVRRILHPSSIAVVGASRTAGTVGNSLFRNLLSAGFCGPLYPVNPNASSVLGVAAYPRVSALPDVPDLAVIAVPTRAVRGVVTECGRAGVAAAVIVTAGFAERASDGVAAQQELVEIARYYGMRLVGPNCVGIVNSDPDVRLNATFSPASATPGPVGFASQSGALGIAALDRLDDIDLGISTFVSLGNKADVSSNDLLQYWEQDPATTVVALYLESFGNPRKFARIAQEFCQTKPIVAVKSGRTVAGRRAASSHTAALASSDLIAESLFADAGIIRVDTLAELFDVSRLLATQPVPAGAKVAIVGNSGGPGILAADACEAAGLEVPTLSEQTQQKLRSCALPGAGVSNPVDLIAAASADQYENALDLILDDDQVDAAIVIYTDPMVSDAADIATAISNAASRSAKPIAANFLAADVGATITTLAGHPPIPVYDFPEAAAHALGHAARLGAWRKRRTAANGTAVIADDADRERARALIDALAPTEGSAWLDPDNVARLLQAWNIGIVETVAVESASQAAAVATRLGCPVALKVRSDAIIHKTDVGGVLLDLDGPAAVRSAFSDMKRRLGSDMVGAVIQPMVGTGIEVIIGGVSDPIFGPVVMFGAGGIAAELWEDRAVALAPLKPTRAAQLIDEPKVSVLLAGHRGSTPVDRGGIEQVLVSLGAMLDAHPEILEVDLNPVIVTASGVQIVDARCRVAACSGQRALPRRQLD